MEILNLIFFTIIYYIIYSLPFYVKALFIFLTCICTSFYVNYKESENEGSKANYEIFNKYSDNIIYYSKYGYQKIISYFDYLITIPGFSHIYKYLEYLNDHFVKGRKIIMYKCGEKVLMPPMIPNFNQNKIKPKIKNYKKIDEKDNFALRNESDILKFLDNLNDMKND